MIKFLFSLFDPAYFISSFAIRSHGAKMILSYSQNFGGNVHLAKLNNSGLKMKTQLNTSGKQDWYCEMNQTLNSGIQYETPRKVLVAPDSRMVTIDY